MSRAVYEDDIRKVVEKYLDADDSNGSDVAMDILSDISGLPSAQPEHLTDDDFETIRIHLNAQKEKFCNQQRWEEAEEYQRIIDRFMAFASAQPEIITCTECKYYDTDTEQCNNDKGLRFIDFGDPECMWCSWAERLEE